jgi:hypothetical protein
MAHEAIVTPVLIIGHNEHDIRGRRRLYGSSTFLDTQHQPHK